MNILHCMHNYYPARGGAEWLMQNVSERLAARGHPTKVIATNAYSVEDYFLPGRGKELIAEKEDTIHGVQVKRVAFSRKGAAFLNLLRKIANRIPFPYSSRVKMISWGPRSRAYLREILHTPDIALIAACPLPTQNVWYAWKAARRTKTPLVIIPCFHTEDPLSFHNPFYFRMLRDADAVVTLTDWEKDYLLKEAGLNPESVHTIGVGVDINNSGSSLDVRKTYGITQEDIVLFLGQHGAHKGILDLLQAMTQVWEERSNAALVIAGNPTAHTLEIEEKIERLKEEEKQKVYLIKGFPEAEKQSWIKAADVFVSVSAFESFGIVFLEAWAEKKPVIGCLRGGSSKLIDAFQDGLLVHDKNPGELAGAILELLEDKELREKMGEAGYRKTVEHHAWDKIIDRWENLYDAVIQRKRASV